MQLKDLSFPEDARSFPSHRQVLEYLQKFSTAFGVDPFVRLNTAVAKTEKIDGRWRVTAVSADKGEYQEDFDRLLVCNGHFSKPQFASIPGVEHFAGRVSHSRSYRTPDAFVNKVRHAVVAHSPRPLTQSCIYSSSAWW
jgi:cation diffusion facilitator CzcD-associated flavoprotein CzcO